MDKMLKIMKVAFILLVPLALQAFASVRNNKRMLKDVKISYQGTENVYITDQEIRNLLLQNKPVETIIAGNLDIFILEDRLDAHQMIEDTEVFLTLDGLLQVDVKQRKPLARINEKNSFYYMDNQGKRMPLSKVYSARVPIVSGGIEESNWESTYSLLKMIKTDDFLDKNVTEVVVFDKDKYRLRLRMPKFWVVLGKAEKLDVKFANLKAFYKKAEKDKLMDTYTEVNLKFENQVVCTRR